MFRTKRRGFKTTVVGIKLESYNRQTLDEVSKAIKDIAVKSGVEIKGPTPNPVKKVVVGGRELKLHSRAIQVYPDERVLKRIFSISIPEDVKVSVVVEEKEKKFEKV